MTELLRAPTEGYAEAILVPPILAEYFELKHSLINMMTSDQFFELEKDNPHDHIHQDSLNSAAGGNLLERRTQDVLTIIKNKFKVRNSRNKSIVSQLKSSDVNSSSSFEIAKLTHAVNQQTSDVTTAMTAILKQFQATPPPASGNFGYRPSSVANQIRPSGFAQPNVQKNQNRFSQPQGYNRGNNFNHDTSYQAPIQQNQVVPLSELEKIKKIIEVNINAMQTQINNVKNELRNEMQTLIQASMSNQTNELKNMMASFFQMNITSTSGLGSLPGNTIANPKGELKAITTRSGLVLDGPSVPMPPPFINPEEDECAKETLIDPELTEYTIKVPPLFVQKAKPPLLRNYVVHQRDPPVILKKLPKKLRDPREFLIPCGFSELKCKALADLESINMIDIYNDSYEDYLEDLFATNHRSGNPTFSSHTDLTSPKVINPLSGNTNSSSPDQFLEEVADEIALITFPPGYNDLLFDIKFDLREIEYLLNHDPTKEIDSILEDLVDEGNLADPNNDLVDTIPEMFTDEHTLDYPSLALYDDVDDDLVELESDNDDVYDDPFDSKEDKIKESKLLIDELDPPRSSDFLPSLECDSVLYEDFFEVDAFPSTNNKDKVFNPGILIHKNLFEVTIRVTPDKNVMKISISNAFLILEDFNPPLY
nr:reverse transcriptase domain-containing protein [Tanacetum cinerariifolium]